MMEPRGQTILRWALLAVCAASGADLPAQDGALRDSATVQKARNAMVKGKGNKVFYPPDQFNLDDLPHYVPETKASGTLRFWGSNYFTDGNLGSYWEKDFQRYQPDVKFYFHLTTAAAAIPALLTDAADIAPNRKITWKELLAFQRTFSYDPLEITAVHGSFDVPGWSNAIVIVVNKKNPISRLTLRQLDGIYGSERSGGWVGTEWHPEFARGPGENIRTWGQLGLTGEWADKPINVYGLNLEYQQATDLSRWFLKGSGKWNEKLRMYANYARADGTLAIGANLLIQDVGNDPYGIGYGSHSYLSANTKEVALAAAEGGPYVAPGLEAARDGTYPLHDEVYFYVNRAPGKPMDPKEREFIRYVLSQEGQRQVVRDGKYLPLPAGVVREQLKKLAPADTEAVDSMPAYKPDQIVSGTLRLWGHGSPKADFIGKVVGYWENGFSKFHPDIRFEHRMYGTASAIGALYTGAGDLAIMGQAIYPFEIDAFKRVLHYPPQGVEIATGSLDVRNMGFAQVMFVHAENPLSGLTLAQLDAIYGTELRRGAPKNARTWGDLGLTGEWADKAISLYGWSYDNDFWPLFLQDKIAAGSHRWNCGLKGYAHIYRSDGTIYDAGLQILEALSADRYGIAVSNLRYMKPDLRVKPLALAEREGAPYYEATRANLIARNYPLTPTIPAYYNRVPGQPVDPKVREFLRYILSREGQADIVRSEGYLPLNREVLLAQLKVLE